MKNTKKCNSNCIDSLASLRQLLGISFYLSLVLFVFLVSIPIQIKSQPSGGPYGPCQKKYNLPKTSGKIYYVAENGSSGETGEILSKPTTLEAAVNKVNSGDVIILRGGTYRTGNLILNQGITIQSYANERPVLKGTFIAQRWENYGNGLWVTKWNRLFPSKPADWWNKKSEGKKTPLHRFNNDMVFIDGKLLQSCGWEGEVNENTFYIDYEKGLVFIGINPENHFIEITAFDNAIIRTTKECRGIKSDHKGYTLRGITFTQYAYRALEVEGTEPEGLADEHQYGKEVIGTTLENCSISFCSRVAGYFRGDRLSVRNCKITETSTEGLYIIASNDVLLEKNIFSRNNNENITGYFPAAVKIFNQCHRVTCRDNLVMDLPNSNGVWYDVGNVDAVFINNWVEGVGRTDNKIATNQLWPSDNGFFFEISKGALCAGNVFANCDHGVMVLNSSNVDICQNTFVNSMVCIGRNGRNAKNDHFGWHPSTGPDLDERIGHTLRNNLITGDESFSRPLQFVWQPDSLCEKLKDSQLMEFDNNVFVRKEDSVKMPLILWSPAKNNSCQTGFSSLQEINQIYPLYCKNSAEYLNYIGPLFMGEQLKNYRIVKEFPGIRFGQKNSKKVQQILGTLMKQDAYIGAYPPED
jgi:hypothetical protein